MLETLGDNGILVSADEEAANSREFAFSDLPLLSTILLLPYRADSQRHGARLDVPLQRARAARLVSRCERGGRGEKANATLAFSAVPMGLTTNGYPTAIQMIAAPNQERLLCAAAQELERAYGGWQPAPTLVQ